VQPYNGCPRRESEKRVRFLGPLYLGSYYLIGYAVECALKAYVAKQVRRYDFPDKKLANEAFTHDLEKLVRVAGLIPILERDMRAARALR